MTLHRYIIGIAVAFFLLSAAAHASVSSISVNTFQGELIGPGDFDRLVFDFTLTPPSGDADTLAALGFRNSFDARGIRDITKLVLWKDRGQPGFRGWEDEKIATSAWSVDRTNWSFSELSVAIPSGGQRFFITAEIAGRILARKRLELVIPISDDRGTIGVYDAGDEGLFFGSKKVLPTITEFAISSGVVQTIHTRDLYSPLTYITAPSRGGTIPLAAVRITGVTRERGRDFVREIIATVTSSDGKLVAEFHPSVSGRNNTEEWEFNWTPLIEGAYTVSAIGIDDNSVREETNEGNTATFQVLRTIGGDVPPERPSTPLPTSPLPSEGGRSSADSPPSLEGGDTEGDLKEKSSTPSETINAWSCGVRGTCEVDFARRLVGKIILKVQGAGEAFYVDPKDQRAYYLGRPADAFQVMRYRSLGISEDNFAKVQAGDGALLARLRGRILLRVNKDGEAWYVPMQGEPLFLNRPADAFRIMREQGMGISDENLSKLDLVPVIVQE